MLDKMKKCILVADLYIPAPKFHDMKLKLALYMTVVHFKDQKLIVEDVCENKKNDITIQLQLSRGFNGKSINLISHLHRWACTFMGPTKNDQFFDPPPRPTIRKNEQLI